VKTGEGSPTELFALLKEEDAFTNVDFDEVLDPRQFVGRSRQQVEEFIAEHVDPIRKRYAGALGKTSELDV
jgi:adenylosuccinate lyase